jgi:predicted TIM-barrel fold metal-dependent hydrolase
MAYAPAHRAFYDADSHIMELPDFLKKYADPKLRDEIPEVSYKASLVTDEEVAVIVGQGSRHSPEHVAAQIALGDRLIESSKEIQALGAFDGADRSRALDLLGFKRQLVFATHSVAMPFSPSSKISPELRYGATRAHNRHMADFCSGDERLLGVAIIPLDEPELAIAELDAALAAGLKAVWVPHRPPAERSPGHIDFDPFWARLAESGTPFLLHVGGAPLQQARAWMNNGRGLVADWMGGGENLRTKDIAILHQGPETFLSVLLIDGVFERFPTLRGASVELGAGWVPSLLTRLDWVAKNWVRADKGQTPFTRKPSETLTSQMAFTPFVFEDVGVLIDQSNPELYLFSSDYPHVEGGRDPIKRFEGFLGERSDAVRDAFYAENFLRIFPDARVPEPIGALRPSPESVAT